MLYAKGLACETAKNEVEICCYQQSNVSRALTGEEREREIVDDMEKINWRSVLYRKQEIERTTLTYLYASLWLCLRFAYKMFLLWIMMSLSSQTINSLYDRTFPAEEYDNKDVEDNCKWSSTASVIAIIIIMSLLGTMYRQKPCIQILLFSLVYWHFSSKKMVLNQADISCCGLCQASSCWAASLMAGSTNVGFT